MSFTRTLSAVLFAICVMAGGAGAQNYPDRPVTMLVAFPPGGADDTSARIMQDAMQTALGQPIVIENLSGAGGMVGAAKGARAKPDGYTILMHQVSLVAGMALYPKLTFDAEKDFVTIGLVNAATSTVVGRGDLPPNNFEELLAWLKKPDQNVKIGHAGVGSFVNLAGVLLAQELGIKATQVGYRGGGPALVDLLGGQVDLEVQSAVVAYPLVSSGKLKIYGIIGSKRFAGLPELKTMKELGYDKLNIDFWHMLLAPAGTPAPIIAKLNSAMRTALKDAKVKKVFAEGGLEIYPEDQQSPEAAAALLKSELKLWGDVIRSNHMAAQE